MAEKRDNVTRVAVIMAGGSGERFWPLSRQDRPKQLLALAHPTETLLHQAVQRILPLIPAERVYISTTQTLAPAIRRAKLGIPAKNILAEPCKRNTAGCLCWVTAELLSRHRDADDIVMAILTSDHEIGRPARFRACIKTALDAAERNRRLVTIGIRPTRPETGYGYIEVPKAPGKGRVIPVTRFREKPNRELAEEFVEGGHHFWNSGMFFWRASTFLEEMEAASPLHAEVVRSVAKSLSSRRTKSACGEFERLPDISIDYALMEKSARVDVVEGDFPWDDVGAWDALERSRRHDKAGNVAEGEPVLVDARDCIVVNDAGPDSIAVGVVGAEHLVVIVSRDAVLVTTKDRVQDVRQVARELRARKSRQV